MGFDQEVTWTGVDTYNQPNRLAPGMLQQADNVYVQGKALVSRPGWQGQFTAPMPGSPPLWEPTEYRRSDNGSVCIVFAAGTPSTGSHGRLYQWSPGAGTPTEITQAGGTPFAFTAGGQNVRLARHGLYLYGCDSGNGSGSLFRVSLEDGTAAAYPGLAVPTTPPVVTLTSTTLDTVVGTITAWATRGVTSPSNMFPNPDFSVFSLTPATYPATANPAGGYDFTGTTDFDYPGSGVGFVPWPVGWAGNPPIYVNMDDPTDGMEFHATVANAAASVPSGYPAMKTDRIYVHLGDSTVPSGVYSTGTGLQALQITVTPYMDSGGTVSPTQPLIPQSQIVTPVLSNTTNQANYEAVVFEFGNQVGIGLQQIVSYKVKVTGAPTNVVGASNDVGFANPVALPYGDDVLIQPVSSGIQIGLNPTLPASFYGKILGSRVIRDYGSGGTAIFATQDDIVFNLQNVPGSPPVTDLVSAGLSFYLSFIAPGGSVEFTSNPVTFSTDGTVATVDISTIDPTDLASIRFMTLVFDSDINLAEALGGLFIITSINGAGNQLVGGSLTYIVTEQETVSGPNVIESSGVQSAAIVPTVTQAEVQIVLAAPVNVTLTALTDTFNIYKGGGAISDGFWRLIAQVPLGSDAASTPPGLWTWDHTSRTFVDNTRDSDLFFVYAYYQENRDQFPLGITCLTVKDSRLFAATGATVYASWLLNTDSEAGLYTSLLNDPADPSLAIKGAMFTLGSGSDGDTVDALVTMANAIVALRSNVLTTILGSSPEDFQAIDQYRNAGLGIIAPRSAAVMAHEFAYGDPDSLSTYVKGDPMVAYLSGTGLDGFNLDVPRPLSRQIEGYLSPARSTGDILPPALFGLAALTVHDQRLHLFCPQASTDTTNTVVYVFDMRQGGWTRWNAASPHFTQFTGGVSTGTVLYAAGFDGQLYQLGGTVDKATPSGSAVPIAVSVLTRQWGEDGQDGAGTMAYWYSNRAVTAFMEFATAEEISPSISVFGSDIAASPFVQAWQADADGETSAGFPVGGAVRGPRVWMGLSASTSLQFVLRSLGLLSVETRRR